MLLHRLFTRHGRVRRVHCQIRRQRFKGIISQTIAGRVSAAAARSPPSAPLRGLRPPPRTFSSRDPSAQTQTPHRFSAPPTVNGATLHSSRRTHYCNLHPPCIEPLAHNFFYPMFGTGNVNYVGCRYG